MSVDRDTAPVPADRSLAGIADDDGARWALAAAALVATVLACAVVRLEPPATLVVLALAAAMLARGHRWIPRAGLGGVAWALVTGFGFHRYGQLVPAGPDLVRLLALLAVTTLAEARGPRARGCRPPARRRAGRG
ncbi:hypothetical protein [Nocardioides sp.]|uniref:hypothetical protein n=1 Tax=Nocardioides sp. TaxID=35761 RepID=UPI0035138900